MLDKNLCTPAWLLIGMTGSSPGVLELVDGKIGFTSSEGRVFEALFSDIEVKFPWYYFGGGCKVSVAQQTYRISFVKPNGAADLPGSLLSRTSGGGALGLLTASRKLQDIGRGRKAGKTWKTTLAPPK